MKQIYKIKEDCLKVALLCQHKSQFAQLYPGAAAKAKKEEWYTEITSHMRDPKIIWTKPACIKEALKYTTKTEFRKGSPGCYGSAYQNGLLNDICGHMTEIHKSRNFYNKVKCTELALLCNSRKEFSEKFNSAWQASIKNNWMDEICSHMLILNDKKTRDIYAIKSLINDLVYIGLTFNIEQRYKQHLSHTTIKVKKILNEKHELITLEKHLPVNDAVQKEKYWIDYYRILGFEIANINKAGSIGAPIERIWTKERVQEEALKVKSRTELYRKFPGAYDAAQSHKWLDEIFLHLPRINKIRKTDINGEILTLTEIAKKYGKTKICISKRYGKGKRGNDLIK